MHASFAQVVILVHIIDLDDCVVRARRVHPHIRL
jgi:hypothetical protein